jgi:hypothetical protein
MIMTDDNANYARVKRWREKHRGLANLRQREYRKKKKGGDVTPVPTKKITTTTGTFDTAPTVRYSGSAQFETKKVGEFWMLPEMPKDEPAMPAVKPKVFFNDHGAQISEKVWNDLQERKRIANEAGYEFDPQ